MRQLGSETVVAVASLFSEIGPGGQLAYVIVHTILLFCIALLALRSWLVAKNKSSGKRLKAFLVSDLFFAVLLFLFVFLWRFPYAITGYLNPDEGVWIACAKALLHDPRIWISADTTTSGPLVVLPIIAVRLLGFPIDFGSLKVASGLVLGLTLVFTFLANVRLFGSPVARLTILFLAIALGLNSFPELLAYNGEQMPLLLLSIALWQLSACFIADVPRVKNLVVAGIVLGMIPYAKLQSVPLGLLLAGGAIFLLISKKSSPKYFISFLLSGLVPTVFVLLWLVADGGLSYFWNAYIVYNLFYAVSGVDAPVSLHDKLIFARDLIMSVPTIRPYLQISLCITVLSLVFIDYRELWRRRNFFYLSIFSILYFLASLYCIGQPYRWFEHYTYLFFLPLNLMATCLLSVVLLAASLQRKPVLVIATFFACALYFHQVFTTKPSYQPYISQRKDGYCDSEDVMMAINEFSETGDKIVIWGWSNAIYSETDLILGTRFTDTAGILYRNSFSPYIEQTLLSDMEKNSPKIFLDAITPHAFRFADRGSFGFDKFPAVAAYITEHYEQKKEVMGYRIYVRK